MNWTDELILAVLLLSVLAGLWRGLISEVMALGIWLVAAWVAWCYGPAVSARLPASLALPSGRIIAGYLLCFIAVLIAGALLRSLLDRLIESTGMGGTDRLLGMLFGLLRGVLLVTLLVFLLGFTAFTRDPWWHQSRLLPQFEGMAAWLSAQLPADIYQQLNPARLMRYWPAAPRSVQGHIAVPPAAISSPGAPVSPPVAT
ncbi:CvpA family protein [Frateuria aurantia]